MIDLTRLQVFLSVAENLSFSDAAQRLHISQPTVSHHIKALEQALGVELFDRSSHRVKMTGAARLLYPRARKLLGDTVEIQQIMDSLQEQVVGHLRIACSTTAGKYILPQFAARFHERHPGVGISISRCTSTGVIPHLLEDDADLGAVSFEACEGEVECQVFFEDRIVLIVPAEHPWAKQEVIEPSDLLGENMILREPTSGTCRVLSTELGQHDIALEDLNAFLELGSSEAIVMTVEAGFGVSFVSRIAASCPLAMGLIAEVPVAGFDLRRKIYMIRKKLRPANRALDAFWGFVHDPANIDLLAMARE
ncbi:MAG: LysR family transcriptional regulator [Anaerolineales bacterium]|nr:LysR family transcriptional regulator [Anaerolineales bacterium]